LRESLTGVRPPDVRPPELPGQEVLRKVRAGIPLLHGEPVFVDVHYAADLFERLLNILLARDAPDAIDRAAAVVAAATEGRLDPDALFSEAFAQHRDHVAELARAAGVDADYLVSLATLAVAPIVRAYSARLGLIRDQVEGPPPESARWSRGYCPVCGGLPLLAELRGVELHLALRCAACGLGWRSRRIFCPFCETDDHHRLHSLQVEGDQRFHVQVCDGCHSYLKIGNAFDPPPAELLPLDDLASVNLDVVATDRGYTRPAEPGYRLNTGASACSRSNPVRTPSVPDVDCSLR
jgi:FdhE protein